MQSAAKRHEALCPHVTWHVAYCSELVILQFSMNFSWGLFRDHNLDGELLPTAIM